MQVNERLKQLAEQAGIYPAPRRIAPTAHVVEPGTLAPHRQYVSNDEYISDNFEVVRAVLEGYGLEKFACLIVQECAERGFKVFDEDPDASVSDLQYQVRDRINQHFGINQ